MHYLTNIVAIFVVAVVVFFVLQFTKGSRYDDFRRNVEKTSQNVEKFIKVKKHNIELETQPTRKVPMVLLEQEDRLRSFIPDVFGKFTSNDWQQFWLLVYTPVTEKQDGFDVKRYRTKEEIQSVLKDRFPYAFTYFREEYWRIFWSIIKLKE